MALTRHRLIKNSRQLRFGRSTLRYPSDAPQSRRIGKSLSLAKPASERIKKASASRRYQPNASLAQIPDSNIGGDVVPTSPLGVLRSDEGHTSRSLHEAEDEEFLFSNQRLRDPGSSEPNSPVLSGSTHDQPIEAAEEDRPSSTSPEQTLYKGPSDVERNPLSEIEDVGVPIDGAWDHNAAYERKFCYDHGEFEYLLGVADRWMFATDFDFHHAEAALETLLQKHRESPSEFDSHSRRCQAECRGSLYSHVFSVVNQRKDGDRTLYLVRWKACWTPESNIDNTDWIDASMEANMDPRRRYSARLARGVEMSKTKYERIMTVVNIE